MSRMSDLQKLLEETPRPAVTKDLAELTETTVSNQSGLTGMALKSALAAGKKADANAVSKGINKVLPMLVERVEPYWANYQGEGSASGFGGYLAAHQDEVVDDIVKTADASVDSLPGAVKKVYTSLRSKASKIVAPALPGLGEIIERHAK